MFGEIIDANSSDKKLADLRLQKIGFVFQVGPLLHSLQLWPQRAAVLMAGETGSLRIDVFLMLMDQMPFLPLPLLPTLSVPVLCSDVQPSCHDVRL